MARFFGFALVILTVASPAFGAGKGKNKSNCKVELIKEASAGSILIDFEADDKDDCERAKSTDVQISYSGQDTPKKAAAPSKPKK